MRKSKEWVLRRVTRFPERRVFEVDFERKVSVSHDTVQVTLHGEQVSVYIGYMSDLGGIIPIHIDFDVLSELVERAEREVTR